MVRFYIDRWNNNDDLKKDKKIHRLTCLIILLMCVASTRMWAGDTLHVITHNKEIVVTDPSKGNNPYLRWGVFPGDDVPVRKIILHVKFGCPDSVRCADWDYMDRIYMRRTGGAKAASKDFEIARMLTPYGGAFGKDWQFGWEADVTDFSFLLRDSVEIEYNHSGYEPNHDRGWHVTLDFEIIQGTPALEPISVQRIYDGFFSYGDSANSIENALPPVTFTADKQASFAVLKVLQTGHGMDESGCGEFCRRYREIYFDDKLIDKKDIWKKCGLNPLYPQAGTWIFDRANWCPGDLLISDNYILPLQPGVRHSVNIDMEPYQTKSPSATEVISAYVFQYKKNTVKNDVSVEAIIVPSDNKLYARSNPSCANPVIVIKNSGANTVKEVTVKYGTGRQLQQYKWKGELPFGQLTEVTLPPLIGTSTGKNRFTVTLLNPNGKKDAYRDDNMRTSSFQAVPVYGKTLVFYFRSNNDPQHNYWYVKNSAGKVVHERRLDSLQSDKLFTDTLRLDPGCYELVVRDTAGDGLEFWYNVKGGRGVARLLDEKGRMLKNFESDFGSEIYHGFTVSHQDAYITMRKEEPSIGLFPTRTRGKTTLDYFANEPQDVTVQIITDEGSNVVEEHTYHALKEGVFSYDLSYRAPQRYYLRVFIQGELKFNKRIRVEDLKR